MMKSKESFIRNVIADNFLYLEEEHVIFLLKLGQRRPNTLFSFSRSTDSFCPFAPHPLDVHISIGLLRMRRCGPKRMSDSKAIDNKVKISCPRKKTPPPPKVSVLI